MKPNEIVLNVETDYELAAAEQAVVTEWANTFHRALSNLIVATATAAQAQSIGFGVGAQVIVSVLTIEAEHLRMMVARDHKGRTALQSCECRGLK